MTKKRVQDNYHFRWKLDYNFAFSLNTEFLFSIESERDLVQEIRNISFWKGIFDHGTPTDKLLVKVANQRRAYSNKRKSTDRSNLTVRNKPLCKYKSTTWKHILVVKYVHDPRNDDLGQ